MRLRHSRLWFNTHKSNFYTQSVILTHMSVIMTLTSVITTRTSWISTRRVWILHEPTKINVRLPKNFGFGFDQRLYQTHVWFSYHAYDAGTLGVILALLVVIWTIMRVIFKLMRVIWTLMRVDLARFVLNYVIATYILT
jgi:hypothetical protein